MMTNLSQTLRHYQPVSIRAYDAHDDVRDIAVPHGARTKWKRAAATVDARPWVRLDLLDKGGKVLAHVDNDGPADDIEELSPASSAQLARDERMLALLMRAQRDFAQLQSRDTTELLGACREMMRVVTDATRALAEIQRAQINALTDLRANAPESGGGAIDDETLLKVLAPMLPALLARNAPAVAAAPTNGVKG